MGWAVAEGSAGDTYFQIDRHQVRSKTLPYLSGHDPCWFTPHFTERVSAYVNAVLPCRRTTFEKRHAKAKKKKGLCDTPATACVPKCKKLSLASACESQSGLTMMPYLPTYGVHSQKTKKKEEGKRKSGEAGRSRQGTNKLDRRSRPNVHSRSSNRTLCDMIIFC